MTKSQPSRTGWAAVAAILLLAAAAVPAAGMPVVVPGNPNCPEGTLEVKIESGFDGTHPLDILNTVTVSTDGDYFDWSSTLSLDAVIAKGGPNANVYLYDPESFGDVGLSCPINPNNGRPYGISHISFCFDYEVMVEKTAETSFTRTWQWDITKTVQPPAWNLFAGDTGTSLYGVAGTKTGYTDSDWAVAGTISIFNPAPFDATVEGVTDALVPGPAMAVDCGLGFPVTLAAGQTLECTYGADLPDGAARTNLATVTTSGEVGGGEASAPVVFGEPTTQVNATVHVVDTHGGAWTFSDTENAAPPYTVKFDCAAASYDELGHDGFTHTNTATIVETGQSASTLVGVDCYRPIAEKTVETGFFRTYYWEILKEADQSALVLSPGQQFPVNYEVTVTSEPQPADHDWWMAGQVSLTNPNPLRALPIQSLDDVVTPPGSAVALDCGDGVSFPFELAPSQTLVCDYRTDLDSAEARVNRCTTICPTFDFDWDGTAAPSGFDVFVDEVAVGFGGTLPVEIDRCADIFDTHRQEAGNPEGFLGEVCFEGAPHTFTYSVWVGPYQAPGDCERQFVDDTCTCIAHDTGTEGSGFWQVVIDVACDEGCTLTPGYWKTHSEYGPAPYDDTWALLPLGADTPFFLSGQSCHEVFWTPPAGGNAYYILAHAWLAARLNGLDGASMPPEVTEAYTEAEALLASKTPDEVAKLKGKKRVTWVGLAWILDEYNNGLTGPGHCSEEGF